MLKHAFTLWGIMHVLTPFFCGRLYADATVRVIAFDTTFFVAVCKLAGKLKNLLSVCDIMSAGEPEGACSLLSNGEIIGELTHEEVFQ